MKIVQICGPSHREDGGPLYSLAALKRLPGVECDRRNIYEPIETWGPFDWGFYVDWAEDAVIPGSQTPWPHPILVWQSDTHWTPEGHDYRMAQAAESDIACFAQQDAVKEFRDQQSEADRDNVHWLPHAAEHSIYTPPLKHYRMEEFYQRPPDPKAWEDLIIDKVQHYDISFVGFLNNQRRIDFLDSLFRAVPNFYYRSGLFFQEAARIYNDSRIVFNISAAGDLNMRVLEVTSSRAFLLTDRQQGMEDIGLRDGVNCAIFDTPEEAIEKARYYLAHEQERERIALEGWKWCWAGQTYHHRAIQVVEWMKKYTLDKDGKAL